ncbi:MAG: nucleotidyltransferase domain-containing protein [Nanobdellota archaeon]
MVKNEKIEILKILIANNSKRFTIKELSRIRNINYKSAYEAIEKLGEVIEKEKIGNTNQCRFNNKFNKDVFLAEESRLDELLKIKGFKTIRNELMKAKFPFIAVIFGSYARGDFDKHSDIDLLLISEHPDEIENFVSWAPLNLHLTSITYDEFIEMFSRKSFNVVNETVKNHIILHNTQEYYRLINSL